jgi:hypothetical protein
MIDLAGLSTLIEAHGATAAVVILLIAVIFYLLRSILDPVRSDGLRAAVYGALHAITKKREHEKRYISNDINRRINQARRRLDFTNEFLPTSVRVEWVEEDGGRFYDISEGEFVVCLDSRQCQEQNVVRLATAVVERTTLTGIRHLLDRALSGAIDLNLVRSILVAAKTKRILDWFFAHELAPAISADPALSTWHDQIRETDERGLFTRVLLVEMAEFARRVHGLAPRPFMAGELENLVGFVYRIATKPFGQDVPLSFITAYIKTGLILVADTDKILSQGVGPYLTAAEGHLQRGAETIYLVSWDKPSLAEHSTSANRVFERRIKELVANLGSTGGLRHEGSHTYLTVDSFGNQRTALCARFCV